MPGGAGPGACVPYLDTNSRHDRNASAPGTRCSMTAGIKASSTWPVRPRRKFGSRRCAAATAGCSGTKSLASSAAPSMAGAMSTNSSAPLPHATQRAASRPARLIRAVTGPVGSKLVRQIVPSPGTRKHGSC
ncbi:Uncharacterised protein [Mycobacterium tuberculosis]|uniref:Uncharacterized protein n=2 Tax=Mycobacterium tuberculosis TaxID=1773 RepID=A0A655IW16_MYCTX|nr:Uncharacterised protein [Mycobacterium tuberculosis]CFS37513.1 Uncharacterised protein [Mycobacterium tuberculosis]CFS50946.1 Uncharacterised protein [Mycobacterium tuberculosis]CKM67742.1 Uncharacterised protein [Mycobacterium tuberculosis]CKO92444.1 Uncharacterised protein [Mycobacterium tuberculosis]